MKTNQSPEEADKKMRHFFERFEANQKAMAAQIVRRIPKHTPKDEADISDETGQERKPERSSWEDEWNELAARADDWHDQAIDREREAR